MKQREAPLILLASAVAGLGVFAGANATVGKQQSAPTTVTVTEGSPSTFSLKASRSVVPTGRVTFKIANAGTITHEVAVIRTSYRADSLPGPRTKVSESGNVGESGEVAGRGSKTFTVTLKRGHYALICNLTGHYTGGMHIDLTVR